jgi:hypothetical protein
MACPNAFMSARIIGPPQSNSEQDMKYPQRGHTILQWRDSSLAEHTGQYWPGCSLSSADFAAGERSSETMVLCSNHIRFSHRFQHGL